MVIKRLTLLQEVEDLLIGRQFNKALELLDSFDSNQLLSWDNAFYNLLVAEAKIKTGDYNVLDELTTALTYYKNSDDHNKYARAKSCQGWRLALLGSYTDASEILLESYTSFKRCNDHIGQAIVLNDLAYVSYCSGHLDSAINHLRRCVELIDSSDQERIRKVYRNMSQYYLLAGQLKNATITLEHSKNCSDNQNQQLNAIYFLRTSSICAHYGNFSKARLAISKALNHIKDISRERTVYFEYSGWIHNLEGKYDLALTELAKGLEIATELRQNQLLCRKLNAEWVTRILD